MLRKDLPIRTDLTDGTIAGYGGMITVYANPIISPIRTDMKGPAGSAPLPPPPLWTPSQIITGIWLDASALPAGTLTTWTDLSGNARNATPQAGTTTVISGSQNGLAIVRFSGSNGLRHTRYQGLEYYYVATRNTGSRLIHTPISDASTNFSSGIFFDTFYGIVSTSVKQVTSSVPTGFFLRNFNATNIQFNASDATYTASSTEPTSTATYSFIGCRARGDGAGTTDQYGIFDLGELIGIDVEASTTNKEKLQGYLAHKWGIASLPASHPYYSNPPYL